MGNVNAHGVFFFWSLCKNCSHVVVTRTIIDIMNETTNTGFSLDAYKFLSRVHSDRSRYIHVTQHVVLRIIILDCSDGALYAFMYYTYITPLLPTSRAFPALIITQLAPPAPRVCFRFTRGSSPFPFFSVFMDFPHRTTTAASTISTSEATAAATTAANATATTTTPHVSPSSLPLPPSPTHRNL